MAGGGREWEEEQAGGDAVHGGRCGASGWKSWGGGSRGDEHGIWELIAGGCRSDAIDGKECCGWAGTQGRTVHHS
jgi:hypothetical protein